MRNGSGTYTLPSGNPVVSNTTISSTWANNTLSDIATALTGSIAKDGQTTPTANLVMGGFRHTGVGDALALTQYLSANQAVNGTAQYLSTVAGGDTITASGTFTPSAYAAGQTFAFIAAASNTTAVTINIAGLGAKDVKKRSSGGLVALTAKDLISAQVYSVTYDGTQFVINEQRPYSQGAAIASAGTVNLDTATGDYVHITGTTTVTAITLGQGEERTVVFDGIVTLTYGASLLLPTGASINTAANDVAVFRGEASGVVRCTQYTRADGTALSGTGAAQIQPISASVAANALTISASALSLTFRSTTLGSGTVTTVSGTPASLVISSGSTLGTVSAQQSRIVVIAMNNAGTIELAAGNISGGVNLDETGLISTTAEGGAGAADSATVMYSTTARSSLAYRVIGYIESTQATAGTWATAPSTIQGSGGQALTSMSSLGYSQTWQTVTRTMGTTYYNTTGKVIALSGRCANVSAMVVGVYINGLLIADNGGASLNYIWFEGVEIPPGASYSLTLVSGNGTVDYVRELR